MLLEEGKETLTLVVGVASCIGSAPPAGSGGFTAALSFGNVFGLFETSLLIFKGGRGAAVVDAVVVVTVLVEVVDGVLLDVVTVVAEVVVVAVVEVTDDVVVVVVVD